MARIPKPKPVTVYVLQQNIDYEGTYTYGVFSSIAAAQKYGKDEYKIRWRTSSDTMMKFPGGSYTIDEWVVDHPEMDLTNG
jgi:hypothetical protein